VGNFFRFDPSGHGEAIPFRRYHGYWENPGDAGVPTRIDWRVSKPHKRANTPQPTALATLTVGISDFSGAGSVGLGP